MTLPLIYKSDISYLKNKSIKEYDIVSGGYNITISENLIDDEELLQRLKVVNKKQRQILLGLYAKEDKSFTKKLHKGFQKYVSLFIENNDIIQDKIISINKDSVLFYDAKSIDVCNFNSVNFTLRGEYTSYLKLNNLQFFINSKTNIKTLKGISLDDYTDTLIEEVFKLMYLSESNTKKVVQEYLYEIRQAYVKKELTNSYYKELSSSGGYKMANKVAGIQFYSENLGEIDEFFDVTDITYNYKNIIIPLCDIFA